MQQVFHKNSHDAKNFSELALATRLVLCVNVAVESREWIIAVYQRRCSDA